MERGLERGRIMNTKHISLLSWVFATVWILGFLASTTFGFQVQALECSQDGSECSSQVKQSLQPLLQESLFWKDHEQQILTATQDQSVFVQRVEKKLPTTLLVDFVSVEKLFQVKLDEEWVVIDTEFHKTIQSEPNDSIPEVSLQVESVQNDVLLKMVAETIASLNTHDIVFQDLELTANAVEVRLDNGILVLLPRENGQLYVERLALLTRSLPDLELPTITTIDLRFKHPVLKTE